MYILLVVENLVEEVERYVYWDNILIILMSNTRIHVDKDNPKKRLKQDGDEATDDLPLEEKENNESWLWMLCTKEFPWDQGKLWNKELSCYSTRPAKKAKDGCSSYRGINEDKYASAQWVRGSLGGLRWYCRAIDHWVPWAWAWQGLDL